MLKKKENQIWGRWKRRKTMNYSLHSLVGLCALSVNHNNSYLAYPGSSTIGEITVYDANNLVSLHLTLTQQQRKLGDCCNVSLKHHGEKRLLIRKHLFAPLEHCDADPGPWQSPGSPYLQCIWHETGQRFGEGEDMIYFYPGFCFITYQPLSDQILLNRVLLSESSAFLKDRGCLNSGEGWKG